MVEETGADSFLYGALGQSERVVSGAADPQIVARVTTRTPPARGETVHLSVDPASVHVFDKEARAFYDLDRLWADAKTVDLSDVLAQPDAE